MHRVLSELVAVHEDVIVVRRRLWLGRLLVRLQPVDANHLGPGDPCPRRVWGDPDHHRVDGFSTDSPRTRPEGGQLPRHALVRRGREEPHLSTWQEALGILVVLAPLPPDGAGHVLPSVLLGGVDPLAQLLKVDMVFRGLVVLPRVWFAEDEVKRLADVAAEEELVWCQASRPADAGPDGEEGLWQHVLPGVWPVAQEGPEHLSQVAVHPLNLAVPLRVVAGGVGDLDAQQLAQAREEPAGERSCTV